MKYALFVRLEPTDQWHYTCSAESATAIWPLMLYARDQRCQVMIRRHGQQLPSNIAEPKQPFSEWLMQESNYHENDSRCDRITPQSALHVAAVDLCDI